MKTYNVVGRVILKWSLKNLDERMSTGFTRVRIGANGGLLYTR
jgi:hypothetical protein